jgi:amidophosphoribosyltransferase
MGLVSEVFTEKVLDRLDGQMAVGHSRYSTTGATPLRMPSPDCQLQGRPPRPGT